MKFTFKHSASVQNLIMASLLATLGAGAMAQGAPATTPAGAYGERMHRHDPAKMQAWIAKHQAELKAKLNITPAQEGAWTAYTAAMQPPAHGARPSPEQRDELNKLPTPQRIDKMRALRTERMTAMAANMDKRGEATKTFYAALTPDQQKIFDADHKRHGRHGEHGGPDGHRGQGQQKN